MVYLAKKADSLEVARAMLEKAIEDGSALDRFKTFLSAQGGDSTVVDNPEKMPQAKYVYELEAKEDGYVSTIVADEIGTAAMILGAGRATKDSVIDLAVGLMLRKKIGDEVKKGESLVTIYSNDEDVTAVKEKLYENIKISKEKIAKPTLIHREILK